MGILLTFMFIWNMLGALALIPALSHFILNPRRGDVRSLT
jgi:predicted RND superfamily exporter protein